MDQDQSATARFVTETLSSVSSAIGATITLSAAQRRSLKTRWSRGAPVYGRRAAQLSDRYASLLPPIPFSSADLIACFDEAQALEDHLIRIEELARCLRDALLLKRSRAMRMARGVSASMKAVLESPLVQEEVLIRMRGSLDLLRKEQDARNKKISAGQTRAWSARQAETPPAQKKPARPSRRAARRPLPPRLPPSARVARPRSRGRKLDPASQACLVRESLGAVRETLGATISLTPAQRRACRGEWFSGARDFGQRAALYLDEYAACLPHVPYCGADILLALDEAQDLEFALHMVEQLAFTTGDTLLHTRGQALRMARGIDGGLRALLRDPLLPGAIREGLTASLQRLHEGRRDAELGGPEDLELDQGPDLLGLLGDSSEVPRE